MNFKKACLVFSITSLMISSTLVPSFAYSCSKWNAKETSSSCVRDDWEMAKDQSIGDWLTEIIYTRTCVKDNEDLVFETKTETIKDGKCRLDD